MRRDRNRWLTAYAIAVYVFLFLPIAILILFSFNDSRRNFAWVALDAALVPAAVRQRGAARRADRCTLEVAMVAVIVATVLGTLLGLGLTRLSRRARGPPEALLLLPMVTPEIVMGISLLLFFGQLFGGQGSIQQIAIAHITFCISYVADRRPGAGREPRPAARGGRARPRVVGVGRVPVRHAAAAAARRSRPARCSRSRCRSTT